MLAGPVAGLPRPGTAAAAFVQGSSRSSTGTPSIGRPPRPRRCRRPRRPPGAAPGRDGSWPGGRRSRRVPVRGTWPRQAGPAEPAGQAGPAGSCSVSMWATSRTRNGLPPVSARTSLTWSGVAGRPAARGRRDRAGGQAVQRHPFGVRVRRQPEQGSAGSAAGSRVPGRSRTAACGSHGAGARRRPAGPATPRPPTEDHRARAAARLPPRTGSAAGGPRRTARTAGHCWNHRPRCPAWPAATGPGRPAGRQRRSGRLGRLAPAAIGRTAGSCRGRPREPMRWARPGR